MQTFDGERCLYAALNARVRNVLLEKGFKRAGKFLVSCTFTSQPVMGLHFKVLAHRRQITSIVMASVGCAAFCAGARQHDLYLEFLEKLFNNANACTDIEFAFGAECIRAHCFVLAARCPLLGKDIRPAFMNRIVSWLHSCVRNPRDTKHSSYKSSSDNL